ncbi:MAG: hypothetical protein ACI8RA_002823 [Chlamydiales bacterium]|jgi:hypothetical protein
MHVNSNIEGTRLLIENTHSIDQIRHLSQKERRTYLISLRSLRENRWDSSPSYNISTSSLLDRIKNCNSPLPRPFMLTMLIRKISNIYFGRISSKSVFRELELTRKIIRIKTPLDDNPLESTKMLSYLYRESDFIFNLFSQEPSESESFCKIDQNYPLPSPESLRKLIENLELFNKAYQYFAKIFNEFPEIRDDESHNKIKEEAEKYFSLYRVLFPIGDLPFLDGENIINHCLSELKACQKEASSERITRLGRDRDFLRGRCANRNVIWHTTALEHEIGFSRLFTSNGNDLTHVSGRNRDVALFIRPHYDHNGAFEISKMFKCQLGKIARLYDVKVRYVGNLSEMKQVISQEGGRNIKHLSIGGHGNANIIMFGEDSNIPGSQLSADDYGELKSLSKYLARDGSVALHSCDVGKTIKGKESISKVIARAFKGRKIYACREEVQGRMINYQSLEPFNMNFIPDDYARRRPTFGDPDVPRNSLLPWDCSSIPPVGNPENPTVILVR